MVLQLVFVQVGDRWIALDVSNNSIVRDRYEKRAFVSGPHAVLMELLQEGRLSLEASGEECTPVVDGM